MRYLALVGKSAQLSWLQRRDVDRKVAGSMPILGSSLLCPWKKLLLLISLHDICMAKKTSTGVGFTAIFTGEKKSKNK